MSIHELTSLITAIAGLIVAIAQLIHVWRGPP